MKQRKHFSHLPSADVLDEALKVEAKRNIPVSKQSVNYPEFDLFLSWMHFLKIDTEFFERASNWQDLITSGNEIRELVSKKTLEQIDNNNKSLQKILLEIQRYLGSEDEIPEEIDVILVFGSKDLGRIRKVDNIYKNHSVEKILISGGARYDTQEKSQPEAVVFQNEAIKLGIPSSKIIVEPNSITIADNVRSGLNQLDILNIKYNNIVTMVSWFAQRRAWSHLMKYTDGVDIICVNSDPKSVHLSPGSWYQYEVGINTVFSEFLKMKMAVMLNTA